MNNQEAMEALRSSMLKDAPVRGHISLVVARRVGDAGNNHSSRSCSGEHIILEQMVKEECFKLKL